MFCTHEVSQEKCPNSRGLAIFVLTMFGSTYMCKSSFSHINAIKMSSRASLTSQHLCMRFMLTTYTPSGGAAEFCACELAQLKIVLLCFFSLFLLLFLHV